METEISYGSDYHYLPVTSIKSGDAYEIRPDILCHTVQIVNVSFIGYPSQEKWVLIDAGMPKSADAIIAATEERFGVNSRPEGIVLTHGHFDHVGAIIVMHEWHWIHTPGHTPGHISLFRDSDRSLIAGDAFVTVKQESIYKVFTQEQEISGPPRYLTPDWQTAWKSVRALEAMNPAYAITGHGLPMTGDLLTASLQKLVTEFDRIAIPD